MRETGAEVEQSLKGEIAAFVRISLFQARDVSLQCLGGDGLAAFSAICGINIIFYYVEILWKAAGATDNGRWRINLLPACQHTRHDPGDNAR